MNDALDYAEHEYLRWPWAALDTLVGGMAPGTLHYVAGFSGRGKTTFIQSAMLRWAAQGVRCDILPLETTPELLTLNLACLSAGIDPGLMASGDYWKHADAEALRATATRAYRHAQHHLVWSDPEMPWPPKPGDEWMAEASLNPIRINGATGIDLVRLNEAAQMAVERGARALIIDHVGHLTADADPYRSSLAVNRRALDLAKGTGLVIIALTQANQNAMQGNRDALATYAPLRENCIEQGGHKRQLATTMLGLFRPVRDPRADETPEDFKALVAAVRAGTKPANDVLLKGATGVNLLKHRNYGSREGNRVLLGWKNGEIVEYEQLPHSLR